MAEPSAAAAALEASLAALRGEAHATPVERENAADRAAPLPLRFDGHRWDRTGRGAHATDAFGNALPAIPIAPSWFIESLTQTWAAEPAPIPRSGLCLDVDHNDEGEPVYICLEEHSEALVVYLHRLDIAADDVNMACPGDRHVKPLRKRVMQALGGSRGVQIGRETSPDWLAGTFATLGVLLRARTGRS